MKEHKKLAANISISLTKKQLELFAVYADFLAKKNKILNLTAVVPEQYFSELFLDSLLAVKTSLFKPGVKMVDIGSGAGFPALPLKIYYPQIKLFLVEARAKKVSFLEELVSLLGLNDVFIINERAETLAHQPGFRESFNLATARAVATLPILLEYCLPFVNLNGYFIAYKGPKAEQELSLAEKALGVLGGKAEAVKEYVVAGKKRVLLIFKKIKPSPPNFPRKAGAIKKRPLA